MGWWSGMRLRIPPQDSDEFPLGILACLSIVLFAQAVNITIIFPFLPFMVQNSFGVESEQDLGYWVGLISSAFMVGRLLTSVAWGKISDVYGRRLVLGAGLVSVGFFSVMFGISSSIFTAALIRFLSGLTNGIVGTCKAYASEVSPPSQAPRAMSVVSVTWALGMVLGPAIGGVLAEPTEKYPDVFSSDSLFGDYPYLLPCLVVCASSMISLCCLVLFLPETLPQPRRVLEDFNCCTAPLLSREPRHQKLEESDDTGVELTDVCVSSPNLTTGTETGTETVVQNHCLKSTRVNGTAEANIDGEELSVGTSKEGLSTCSSLHGRSRSISYNPIVASYIGIMGAGGWAPPQQSADAQRRSHHDSPHPHHPNARQPRQASVHHPQAYLALLDDSDPSDRARNEQAHVPTIAGGVGSTASAAGGTGQGSASSDSDGHMGTDDSREDERKSRDDSRGDERMSRDDSRGSEAGRVGESRPRAVALLLRDSTVMKVIGTYMMIGLYDIMFLEVSAVWAVVSHEEGGLGLSSSQLGAVVGMGAGFAMLSQLFVFPRLADRYPSLTLFVWGMVISCPIVFLLPLVRELWSEDLEWWFYGVLAIVLGIRAGLVMACFTCNFLAINNATGANERGVVNGIAMSLGSVAKAIGPAAGGSIFSISLSHGPQGYPLGSSTTFMVMALICLCVAFAASRLPASLNHPYRA
eukprot:Rmarinus@m.9381